MFLATLTDAFQEVIVSFQNNAKFAALLIGILWAIHILNKILGYRLNVLGIYPRSLHGLVGIFFTPLLHYDFNHLFFNTIPLFVLANLVLAHGRENFYCVSLIIIVLSGLAVWLFGSRSIHIGASGLIMGYFGYLLTDAYFKFTATTILLAVLALYYFGGLVSALFPSGRKDVSWAGHFFGFAAGCSSIYLCQVLHTL